jgi:hypothetical protein
MPDPMDLEAPEPVAAPVVEPVAPPPPADPEDAADEGLAIDTPQGKMVPLSALKAVRGENKGLKKEAAKVPQLEQAYRESQPYVEFIKQNPQLLQRPQPQQAAAPDADPQLVNIAKSLDFYTTDGKPDLDRARVHQNLIRQEAQAIATQIVQPVAMGHWQQAAQQHYTRALQEKLPNGQPLDKNLLDVAWVAVQQRNPAALADPNTIRFITNNVMAEQMRANPLGFQTVAPPPNPPIVTEGVGRRPATGSGMNDTQRQIVGSKIDDKKFAELTKTFTPARPNVLEED